MVYLESRMLHTKLVSGMYNLGIGQLLHMIWIDIVLRSHLGPDRYVNDDDDIFHKESHDKIYSPVSIGQVEFRQ